MMRDADDPFLTIHTKSKRLQESAWVDSTHLGSVNVVAMGRLRRWDEERKIRYHGGAMRS